MKRILCLILVLLMLLPMTGCDGGQQSDKLQVICTVFPQYDWVRNIVGETDGVELTLLMDNGADPHNYQASVAGG